MQETTMYAKLHPKSIARCSIFLINFLLINLIHSTKEEMKEEIR